MQQQRTDLGHPPLTLLTHEHRQHSEMPNLTMHAYRFQTVRLQTAVYL